VVKIKPLFLDLVGVAVIWGYDRNGGSRDAVGIVLLYVVLEFI
jgi:hypothetical protein